MSKLLLCLSVALTFLGAQPAYAQRPVAPSGEDIVVEGRGQKALEKFIDELTTTYGRDQLARWNGHVCIRAIGLASGENEFLADRIAQVAKPLRIPIDRGKCVPNIIVVVADDPDGFAKLLFKRFPALVGSAGHEPESTLTIQGLLDPRPVRWLNSSDWDGSDGTAIIEKENRIYSASRLQEPTRESAVLSLVLVDANKVEGITWGALADYVAMVALARPNPSKAYSSGSSILTLFADRDAGRQVPTSLTPWDRQFLKGLYATSAKLTGSAQRSEIRAQVKRGLEQESTQSPDK